MKKAVVLLSGGLDSTTCMAVAKEQGYELYPISFNYHQRHSIELEGAKKIAQFYNVKKHLIIETNMDQIGGSALTDEAIEVPDGDVEKAAHNEIPVTYVPARNLTFLSYALGYSGYPDCRPEFIEKFQAIADYATKAGAADGRHIRIETPLQNLSKKEIVQLGSKLGAPLQFTHSCYKGGAKACGVCDSCKLRLQGFAEAGVVDPVEYENM